MFKPFLVSIASLLLITATNLLANDPMNTPDIWTQWRGPLRTGKVSSAQSPWPRKLDNDHLQQTWRVKLGPSYSGPVVDEKQIYVTETVDRKKEVVRALDRVTGEEIWKTEWAGTMTVPFFAWANGSWIRSTPALSEGRLYVAGMRDVLVCLDASTGKEIWRVDFMKTFKSQLPAFGFVASPLIDGNDIYVQAGGGVVKLNRINGEVHWRGAVDGGGMMGSAFSSPIIATIANTRQLVAQSRKSLMGLDLENGETLWSVDVPAFRGMNIHTPTVVGDRVFTSSYGGGSFMYAVEKTLDRFSVKALWRNKLQGYMSSPIVIDGHAYMHLRNQRFACLDLKTGKETWITTPHGKYWSLVSQNDHILALDERGELFLLRANPRKFELIDQRKISDEPTWAHLAVCGGEVFIRELNAMAVYSWDEPEKE